MSEPHEPDTTVKALRAGAVTALALLIVLGVTWETWIAPTGSGTLAVKVLPLVLCLAGLLRHRMYTFRWLSLLVWLYFMEGAVRAASDRGLPQALAFVEIALSLALFTISTIYIRRRLRGAGAPT